MPGTADYNPKLPWILKICKDELVAFDITQYVDDVRIMTPTEELAWLCSSKMAKGLAFLGLHDAARKRRISSQTPGAWAGSMVSLDGTVVRKGVTQECWEKVKSKIRWIANKIGVTNVFTPATFGELSKASKEDGGTSEGKLHFKTTESCVGFLLYVSMTYTSMIPYLKGIYRSLNA